MSGISDFLQPPYYAVIFRSRRNGIDEDGYARTAERMVERARGMPGYLGHESVRDDDGVGITVSYWSTIEAIETWRNDPEHLTAQRLGRETWYAEYTVRIARVERIYGS